jgi:hypothetical protein
MRPLLGGQGGACSFWEVLPRFPPESFFPARHVFFPFLIAKESASLLSSPTLIERVSLDFLIYFILQWLQMGPLYRFKMAPVSRHNSIELMRLMM